MNLVQLRTTMITQQIQAWDVHDERVLSLLNTIPREFFVPDAYRELSFAETMIPLAHHQCMMRPAEEAKLLDTLPLTGSERILEVGTSSGYLTALLAKAGQHVDSLELFPDLQSSAAEKFKILGITNLSLAVADATQPRQGSYEAIAVTGSLATMPQYLLHQLKIGGRMFVVIGEKLSVQTAYRVTRLNECDWQHEPLYETSLPYLIHAEPKAAFSL